MPLLRRPEALVHDLLLSPRASSSSFNNRTEPSTLKAGTKLSDPTLLPDESSLKADLNLWRGASGSWSVNLSPLSGFPAIVVPAGFTRQVYDRVPDPNDPNGSRLEGPKPDQVPVAVEFLGRPFDEATLLRAGAAFQRATDFHARCPEMEMA